MNEQNNYQNHGEGPMHYRQAPAKSSNNSIIITAIICATVLIIGVLAFLMLRQSDSKAETAVEEKTEVVSGEDKAESKDNGRRQATLEDIPEGDVAPAKKKARTGSLSNIGFTDDYSDIVCYSYLSDADLRNLTKSELRILRNTIYARHGRKFKSKDLSNYFSMFDWYVPRYDEISVNSLSDIEKHNINLIQKYE